MPGKLVSKFNGSTLAINPRRARISRLRRRCYAWSTALQGYLQNLGKGRFRLVMITLTYHGFNFDTGELLPDYGWEPGHIKAFMKRLRRHCGHNLKGYAWVAEVQERGAVHYHVIALVAAGTDIPKPDEAGWWLHGSTRIETARSPFYIMKYAQKGTYEGDYGESVVFPKGLRVFAVWIGDGVIDDLERWTFRLSALPCWLGEALQGLFGIKEFPTRSPGGGWLIEDDELGEMVLRGEWEYVAGAIEDDDEESGLVAWMGQGFKLPKASRNPAC